MPERMREPGPLLPALTTLIITSLLFIWTLSTSGWDAMSLVHVGTRYSRGDPEGSQGYDGQFVFFIATNPDPSEISQYLDVPAYRYQRILLPLLSRLLALGSLAAIPWMIPMIGIFSHFGGTFFAGALLKKWGVNSWYALLYGLWAGFLLAFLVDLPEPLTYALVLAGIYFAETKRRLVGWVFLAISLFAKEVSILFAGSLFLGLLYRRHWSEAVQSCLIVFVPFAVFQVWLWNTFGGLGIGSGGEMATPFEVIPYWGLLRIGQYSMVYLVGMGIVFGPTILWTTVWGVIEPIRLWLQQERSWIVIALFLHSLVLIFLPFSTYRETGGLLRMASGMVLAVVLFSARYQRSRALNYSIIWLVLNVFLFKS